MISKALINARSPTFAELNPQYLLSRIELAALGIPSRFLEIAACKGGGPPFIKVGRLTRYRVADVLEWIASNRYENTSQIARRNGDAK